MKKAIYLSGGGARGAYQAGVLKAIQEIIPAKHLPVDILSSVSAGAINASILAMNAEDFAQGAQQLVNLWSTISCDQVYRVSNWSLIESVIRNSISMFFHYTVKGGGYLLDTAPLSNYLETNINFAKINENIKNGQLDHFELTATCYDDSSTVSFITSKISRPDSRDLNYLMTSTDLSCQHVLASASIPLFFPAVAIGNRHYADGGLRLTAPLHAAIQLGAKKILAIGTSPTYCESPIDHPEDISFAIVLSNMLKALFLDNLEKDIEFLTKINQSLSFFEEAKINKSNLRKIEVLFIKPSCDISKMAVDYHRIFPVLFRYLLNGFGSKEHSGDLLSFLLFEATYCKKLIDIGYEDGYKQKNDIERFFLS